MKYRTRLLHLGKQPKLNTLKTSPKYTQAGVYGKCVLSQNQIVFNGLKFRTENEKQLMYRACT